MDVHELMDIHDWKKYLWDYIKANFYAEGKPIYLSFHEQILDELYAAKTLPTVVDGDGVQNFITECNKLITSRYNSVSLNRSIWTPDDDNITLAICFAVQQILAAEDMNARSFYEPYIALMDATERIDNLHRNPFGDDFKKVWVTVEAELLEQLNCTPHQITFKQGSGKNKYRNYPFSQSLLSEKELNELARSFPEKRPRIEEFAKKFILRNKRHLTNRSINKLSNAEFIKRISQQFISYISNNNIHDDVCSNSKRDTNNDIVFEIFCISEGFRPDTYELRSSQTKNTLTPFEALKETFTHGFSILLSTNAGHWKSSGIKNKNVADFRSMILSIDESIIKGLQHTISNKLNLEPDYVEVTRSNGKDSVIKFYEIPFHRATAPDNQISLEELFSKGLDELREQSHSFEFAGGLLVDGLRKNYLIGYSPTSLCYEGEEIPLNKVVTVNKTEKTVGKLFIDLTEITEDCVLQISYNSSNITIGFEKSKFDIKIEVPVRRIENNFLSLSTEVLPEECESLDLTPYFLYFSAFNYAFHNRARIDSTTLFKYSHISHDLWVSFHSEDKINSTVCELMLQCNYSHLVDTFFNDILRTRRIPYPLLLDIKKALSMPI